MAYKYSLRIKTAWSGAGAILVCIWIIWLLDLHHYFETRVYSVSTIDKGFGLGHLDLKAVDNATNPRISEVHSQETQRPLVLYVFFDTSNARKNLIFFTKHALHDAADFLFILNGETDAEKLIPKLSNIRIVKRPNDCYDMGACAEVLLKGDLYRKYNRFIFLNASIRGPFFPSWSNLCWSDVLLDRVTAKVKMVGLTLGCRPHPHVQSMLLALDRTGLEILLFPSPSVIQNFTRAVSTYSDEKWPMIENPGINSCPHDYEHAVSTEIFATPLIRAAGYEIDVLMMAYHSIPNYETACLGFSDGDVLWRGHYYGMDVHPFDTIFAKSNRDNDPAVLDKLTEWVDLTNYSSYHYCRP